MFLIKVCLITVLFISPALAASKGSVLSGYSESGRRSTAEDFEEEDDDDDYTYFNSHVKFRQKLTSHFEYDISSFLYDKDYDSKDPLDNNTRIYKSRWTFSSAEREEKTFKLNLNLNYKKKRFDGTPKSEYDQVSAAPTFTFTKKDLHSVQLTAGINRFDFINADNKDQFKIFGKLKGKRHFLKKKLTTESHYRVENTQERRLNRIRTKQEVMGSLETVPALLWLHRLKIQGIWGQRDSKDQDIRDEDSDFEYWRTTAQSEHRIHPKIKTKLKYQYFKKDYVALDLDHNGYVLKNGWELKALDDSKKRLLFDIGAEIQAVNYTAKTNRNYQKSSFTIGTVYKRKKSWKVSGSLEGQLYDDRNPLNDRNRYFFLLSGSQPFLNGNLTLTLDLKYKYTDFNQRNNTEQTAIRGTLKHKF